MKGTAWFLVACGLGAWLAVESDVLPPINIPWPTPTPEPIPIEREPAHEAFVAFAHLMADAWEEAADKAEAGEKDKAVKQWLADEQVKTRIKVMTVLHHYEQSVIGDGKYDKAPELWRSFAEQARRVR